MKTLTLLLGLLLASSIFAQNDSSRTFGLPEMKIKQFESGKVVTYMFDNSLNIFTLTPSHLLPDTNRYTYKVDIKDIESVSMRNGTQLWKIAGIAGSVGFFLGFIAGGFLDIHNSPTFHVDQGFALGALTAVPFALIGGIIGALSPAFDEYSFTGNTDKQKYDALMKIFKKYRQKR
ncbi:MAG TPA: hypothetical protein PKE39_11050 [Ignavibacteria bacterium]|nr:hypothetical protein [Ignavibacteria bacterium]HMQ99549.1 hypothetical protein [Ignavibacteria bacterium]